MTIDEMTKNASNKGFERGSVLTINLVLAWLEIRGQRPLAAELVIDWEAGNLVLPSSTPQPAPALTMSPTDLGPVAPKLVNRETAPLMGFTGNCCSTCGSYQMVRNGTCEKCNDCGSTTGCS